MTEPELTEEQLRQLEAELERITVDDVLIQTTVTLLNLAARKAALGAPAGAEPAPDWDQVRQAIEGARAILPLLEARHADQLGPVRDTLARLQMAYAQRAGAAAGAAPPAAEPGPADADPARPSEQGKPGDAGPAQRSGRLWVPGQ
jgi:TolA-binding protein